MALTDILADPKYNPTLADLADIVDELDRRIDNNFTSIKEIDGTDVTVSNTTTATEVCSFTLAANTFQPSDIFRIRIVGELLNNTGAARDIDFIFKVGGLAWLNDTISAFAAATNPYAVGIDSYFTGNANRNGFNAYTVIRFADDNSHTGNNLTEQLTYSYFKQLSTFNPEASNDWAFEFKPGFASANLAFTMQQFTVEQM